MASGGVGCSWLPLATAPDGARARRQGIAVAPAPADARLDRTRAQGLAERFGVVAGVGPQLGRSHTACEQLVDERKQVPPLVLAAARHPHGERGVVGVDGYVEAAAGAAPEGARDLRAPLFASTNEASTIARDQSIRSA
jgi:hypothetical protein